MSIKTKRKIKLGVFFFSALLVVGFSAFLLLFYKQSQAAPALNVSVSCEDALLGWDMTCDVTVQNTGPDRGYGLSLEGIFSSSRPDPQGQASVVPNVNYPYSSHTLNPTTGDTTVKWVDIRDLAAGETFTFPIELDLDETTGWEVPNTLTGLINATIYESPALSGPVTGSGSDSGVLYPQILEKRFNQSTGQQQATGMVNAFSYTLTVTNNLIRPTQIATLRDTFPDGLEFSPINNPSAACSVAPSIATHNPDKSWNLTWNNFDDNADGIFNPGEVATITCQVWARYDYEATGNVVVDDTVFTNHAEVDFVYPAPPTVPILSGTDDDESRITATFLTLNKSDDRSDFGTLGNNRIIYTINYTGSEYYTHDTISFTDTLDDGHIFCSTVGQGYVPNDGNPNPVAVADCVQAPSLTPTSVTENSPSQGQIRLVFDIPNLGTDTVGSFNFQTVVDTNYTGYGGEEVVSGDTVSNTVDMAYHYNDATLGGINNGNGTESSGTSTPATEPSIDKKVCHPEMTGDPLTCQDADFIDAGKNLTIGDTATFRVWFNSPMTINTKDILVTDWVPSGFQVDSVTEHPGGSCISSSDGNFVGGDPNNEITGTAFGLTYLQWNLNNVVNNSTWCAEIKLKVQDIPGNADGILKNNLWKMQGANILGTPYSERDGIETNIVEPHLVLDKQATTVPSPLLPGSTVRYTVTIQNTGGGAAEDVHFLDTIPSGMRTTTPSLVSATLNAVPLVLNTDYKISPAYDPGTGLYYIDFNDTASPAVERSIPAGQTLTLIYDVVVDSGVGAGADLNNIATVSYNTRDDGTGRVTAGTANLADDNTDDATVSLAPLTISKATLPTTPVAVGDTITYNIDVTVPRGMYAYWPSIVDTVNRDGVDYVNDSASLSTVSGTPVTAASFDATTNPNPIFGGSSSSTIYTWRFNNYIDNSSQITPYVFRLSFQMVYDGLEDNNSWEFFQPTATDRVTNHAVVSWNNANPPARATNESASSNNVLTDVDQPLLATVKTVMSSPPYYAGSAINYRSVITNNGWNMAYDLNWQDDLPPQVGAASLTSVTHSVNGVLTDGVDFNKNFVGDPLTIDFVTSSTDLAPGQSLTILYSVTVTNDLGAGASLTNTADIDWSSKDGTPAKSRRYDDPSYESSYTADTSARTITISQASIDKTITSPSPANATIGDTVTYRLRVTVPAESVLYSPYINDVLNTDGLSYVAGSAAVAYVSGNPETAASLTPGTPTINNTSPNPGATLRFDFSSNIDNANPDARGDSNYVFDLTFQMLVNGTSDAGSWIWGPGQMSSPFAYQSHASGDTVTLNWNDGATNRSQSDSDTLIIHQPYLVVDKNFSNHTGNGGDVIFATVNVVNNGQKTAFENDGGFDFVDILPDGFINPSLSSITHSANGVLTSPADYSISIAGNDLQIEYNSSLTDLAPGQSLTVIYTVQINPGIGAGSVITNLADVNYSSQSGTPVVERTYDDTSTVENNVDRDQDFVTVNSATLNKDLNVPGERATIGQTFDYMLTINVPNNTTLYNTRISDTIPDGLTVLGTNRSPSVGSITVGPESSGTTSIIWDVGDITNPSVNQIILTVSVRVDNTYHGGGLVNGLPSQDTINNIGQVSWDDADTGGTPHSASDNALLTIAEPLLSISKNAVPTSAEAGENVTYTVTISNSGTSTAYDIDWQDELPSELFNVGSSPVLSSVTHSAYGVLGSPAHYVANFGVNPVTIDFHGTITDPSLDVGESLTIVYVTTVEGGVANGQVLTNTSRVNQYSTLDGVDINERTKDPVQATRNITTKAPNLTSTKEVIGDNIVQRGQNVAFRYTVTNDGTANAVNVDLADILPSPGFSYVAGSSSVTWSGGGSSTANPTGVPGPNLSWDINAVIYPSQSLVLNFNVLVENTASFGTHQNQASATATDGGSSPIPGTNGNVNFDVTNPLLSIDKHLITGQDEYVQVGETVRYDVVVTNNGDTTIQILPLIDTYDTSYLIYQNASPASDNNVDDGVINWTDLTTTLGDLAPGNSHTVRLNFLAKATHLPVTNTANVTNATDNNGDHPPTVEDDDQILSITRPSVAIDKTLAAGQDPIVALNGSVTYTLRITNNGDTVLDILPLRDTYDTGFLTYQSASLTPDDETNDGAIDWSDLTTGLGDLAVGASHEVNITFKVISTGIGINRGDVLNTKDVNNDSAPNVFDIDNNLTVTNPNLSIDKKLTAGQNLIVPIGDTVTYDLVISNVGDTTLTVLPLKDIYDKTILSFQASSLAPDDSTDDGELNWTDLTNYFPDLIPGATQTLTVTFKVVGPSVPAINTARIENAKDENNDTPPPIQDTDIALTTTKPLVSLTKTLIAGQDTFIQKGENVSFIVTLKNVGTTVIDILPFEDTYDATKLSFVSASVDPVSILDDGTLNWTDLTSSFGDLAIGDKVSLVLNFKAVATGLNLKNTGKTEDARDEFGHIVPTVTSEALINVTNPVVNLEKNIKGTKTIIKKDEQLTYVLTVRNLGDTELQVVPLRDTYPMDYLEFVSSSLNPDVKNNGELLWNDLTLANSLEVGQSLSLEVVFKVIKTGKTIENKAAVENALDLHQDKANKFEALNKQLSSYALEEIKFEKLSDPPSGSIVLPGDILTFKLNYQNNSFVDFSGTVITDPLDKGLELIPNSITVGGVSLDMASYDEKNRQIVVNVNNLDQDSRSQIVFKVKVLDLEFSAQGVENHAVLNSDFVKDLNSNSTFHYVDPIMIEKTVEDLNSGDVNPGDEILWKIKIQNIGISKTTHVVITDVIPDGLTYIVGSIQGRGAIETDPKNLRWEVGTLEINEAVEVSFKTIVNDDVKNDTEIKNQAVVDSDQSNPKKSDFPETSLKDDPTAIRIKSAINQIIKTGENNLWLIFASFGAIFGGLMLLVFSSRRSAEIKN